MKTEPSRSTELAMLPRLDAPAAPAFPVGLRRPVQRIIIWPGAAAWVAILQTKGPFFSVDQPFDFMHGIVAALLLLTAMEVWSAFKQFKARTANDKAAGPWDYVVLASTLATTLAVLACYWFLPPLVEGRFALWPFLVIALALPAAGTYVFELTTGLVRYVREFAARFKR
jgi:hypothetical protein